MLLITIWAGSLQSSWILLCPAVLEGYQLHRQRPPLTLCNDISQQSLLPRPASYTSSSQSPQWFIYLSALSSPSPFPTLTAGITHDPDGILMVTHGKKLQPGIPRTRVTVHPSCPAQPQSPVWLRQWEDIFSLTSRSILTAKVICNTRNLGLTCSYRIILHSWLAKTHSLQAA